MELIAKNRKLGVYYITRNVKGEKKTYKNAVHMTFSEEPNGAELYISTTDDGFRLSHKKTRNSVMRRVHSIRNKNSSKYADQTYLNFRGICEDECCFDVYKEGNDYFLKKSSLTVKRSRTAHCSMKINGKQTIRQDPYIRISAEDIAEMTEGLIDPVLVIKEHYFPNIYAEIYYMEKDDAESKIQYKPLSKKLLDDRFSEGESTRWIHSISMFSLSRFFINQVGEHAERNTFDCYRKGKSIIYEPHNMICEICGKLICGSVETYEDWNICEPCGTYVKIISKRAAENDYDLTAAKKELETCFNMLKNIVEEI